MDQILWPQRIIQSSSRIRQSTEHKGCVPSVVSGIMERQALIRLNAGYLHRLLQAGTILHLVHLGEEILNIADGRKGNIPATEEINILLKDTDIIATQG